MDQIDKLILDDGARSGAFRVIQNSNTAYDSSRKRVAEGTYYTDHDAAVAAAGRPGGLEILKLNRINLFNEDVKSKKSNNYIWMIFYFILLAILIAIFFMFI